MEIIKVSIIIPTYNYGHLISETLNCLLTQTFQNWQAIIVDDGSTDNTEEVVKSFILNDKRFNYIKQENKGVSASRNIGLNLAKGEFIQFLDADDLISLEKLDLQVKYLETHPHIAVCTTETYFFESENIHFTDFNLKNKAKPVQVNGSGFKLISDFIMRNLLSIQNPLFRKKILLKTGLFKEGMNYLEDWDFWFRIASANLKFGFLNNNLAYGLVRVHGASASQQSIKIIEAELALRDLIEINILTISFLDNKQKEILIKLNKRERLNTYKKLMAQTNIFDYNKFKQYFNEINDSFAFIQILIKSINLRRKLN